MDRCADGRHALHFIGLLSDGGVHSHQRHLHALLEMAARRTRAARVRPRHHRRPRHVADRRRPLPRASSQARHATALATGRIATVCGRYYAMDRDKRWERTKLAYDAMVDGIAGRRRPQSPLEAAAGSRTRPASPTSSSSRSSIVDADGAAGRPDPRRRLGDRSSTSARIAPARSRAPSRSDDFDGFARPDRPRVHYTTMTVYDRTFNLPVVFTPQTFSGNLADVLADARPDQPAAGRDREVRARHLLLQLRPRGAVPGRGPHPGAVAEGRDLRPDAGDERARHRRRRWSPTSRPASTRS